MRQRQLGTLLVLMAIAATPAPARAVDSFFDIFTELSVSGPPYPTAEVITIVGTNFGGSFHATQEVRVAVGDLNGDAAHQALSCTGQGGGGGAGGSAPGIDSFFDIFIEDNFATPLHWNRRISDIRIVHPPGTPPGSGRLLPVNPGAPPGSVDSFFDVFVDAGGSFFDITYIVADDGGFHTYQTRGTSPSGRMSFFDVFVELEHPGTIDSFFDIFVDFSICCDDDNDGLPELRLTTTADYTSYPVPAASTTWSRIKALGR